MTTIEAAAVQSWINKGGNTIPDWVVPKMVGKRAPNGTFMIHTRAGENKVQARVLVGHIVIDRKGVLYTRPPAEAKGLLQELDEKDAKAYALLPKGNAGPQRVADVAPRGDDTDDITRRIRQAGAVRNSDGAIRNNNPAGREPADGDRKSAPTPQKTAENATLIAGREQHAKGGAESYAKRAKNGGKPKEKGGAQATSESASKSWPPAKGMPPSIENRNPAELNLDDSYQRSTDNHASQNLIRKIAHGWDWRMCLPLVVSKRDDGSLWVIDGQHRLAGAKLRGDIPFLPCCVSIYGSVADEAAMFVAMNRTRKPMNRLDDFHAAIASGDAEAIEIAKLITDAGFTVSRRTGSQSWVAGEVAFTSSIARVLRKHGPKPCAYALMAMAEAFPDEVLSAGASMFMALTKLVISPPADFDPDRLFRALLKQNQQYWADFVSSVKGGEDRAVKMRDALLMAYEDEGRATHGE